MNKLLILMVFVVLNTTAIHAQKKTDFYSFEMKNIKGKDVNLKKYKGKVILIVNTASKCGLTPQYEGLELLYQNYKDKGLVVLGFPCNQFKGQEPGTAEDIEKFCSTKYNVTFPLFDKIEVNGDNAHDLYKYLKLELPLDGKNEIRWNFEKFLIDKEGKPIKRFAPKTKPEDLSSEIEFLLSQK